MHSPPTDGPRRRLSSECFLPPRRYSTVNSNDTINNNHNTIVTVVTNKINVIVQAEMRCLCLLQDRSAITGLYVGCKVFLLPMFYGNWVLPVGLRNHPFN